MSDNPRDRRADDHDDDKNPLEELMRQLGLGGRGGDPAEVLSRLQGQFQEAFGHMQRMFNADPDAPVLDRELVKTAATRTLAQAGTEAEPTAEQRHDLRVAVELADAWLTDATSFATTSPTLGAVWTRSQWVDKTLPVWVRLTDPIVTHLAEALESISQQHQGDLEALGPMADLMAQMRPMLRRAAGGMFAAQMGEALGQLAGEVLSATDLGLPIPDETIPALLPANVAAFAADLGNPQREVEIYLALREVARQRLFASVPWLEPQVIALVEHYAREIRIDPSALENAVEEAQQVGPDQMAVTLDGSLFEPERTEQQEETLQRLENLMALVEGWVDDTVALAAQRWLPTAPALAEAVRRRRAAGGPTQKALQAIVGLDMNPRRVRDAANLWAALRDARGIEGRDEVWAHPDSLPSPADLDDPLGFVQGERADAATDAMNEELRKLLEGEAGSES